MSKYPIPNQTKPNLAKPNQSSYTVIESQFQTYFTSKTFWIEGFFERILTKKFCFANLTNFQAECHHYLDTKMTGQMYIFLGLNLKKIKDPVFWEFHLDCPDET